MKKKVKEKLGYVISVKMLFRHSETHTRGCSGNVIWSIYKQNTAFCIEAVLTHI